MRSLPATAAGDLSANAIQMLAAGLGLAAIIAASADALMFIKWAGVAYLVWLGARMIWKAGKGGTCAESHASSVSLGNLWLQGFLTSAANPKAVVFFAALFPQFIASELPFWPQMAVLSVTYIVLDGLFSSAYGAGASWIVERVQGRAKSWIDRAGGGFMIVAAILLGFKSVARQS